MILNKINIPDTNNVTDIRFGNLIAIKPLRTGGRHRGIVWLWKCDCGKEIERVTSDIKRGHQRSCGCMKKEILSSLRKKLPGQSAFNILFASYKQKADERNLVFELLEKEFITLTKQNCYYCGISPSQLFIRPGMNGGYSYNGIDRVDNTKGYTLDNCVSCCKKCNRAKMIMSKKEFFEWIEQVYNYRIIFEKGIKDACRS